MYRSNLAPTTVARKEKGITGLETAIVLIAFVVVASVFAFTILSAGVFSSEANKQTIHTGLKETRTRLSQQGSVFAFTGDAVRICQNSGLGTDNCPWRGIKHRGVEYKINDSQGLAGGSIDPVP
jgi:flagellin-like protein